MTDTSKEKGVNVLWLVWAWDNGARKYMSLPIMLSRGKIVQDPNGNPSVRFLVLVKLRSIQRRRNDSVMGSDIDTFSQVLHFTATQDVVIYDVCTILCLEVVQHFFHFPHLLV